MHTYTPVHIHRLLLVALLGLSACLAGGDDESESAASGRPCSPPNAGPLVIASRSVQPGGFVNVTIDSKVPAAELSALKVSLEPQSGAKGKGELRAIGDRGYVVTFDGAAQGFFRLLAKNGGGVTGEALLRVASAPPRIEADGTGSVVRADRAGTPATVSAKAVDPTGKPVRVAVQGRGASVGAGGKFSASASVAPGMNFVPVTLFDAACIEFPSTMSVIGAPSLEGKGRNIVRAASSSLSLVAQAVTPKLPEIIKVTGAGSPVKKAYGYTVYFDGATMPGQQFTLSSERNPGAMSIQLIPKAGGLFVVLKATSGDLVAQGRVGLTSLNRATMHVSNFYVGGDVTFQGTKVNVKVTQIGGDFKFDIDNYPDWIGSFFTDQIKESSTAAIEQKLPGLLESSLLGLQGDVPIPAMPGAKPTGQPKLHYDLKSVEGRADSLVIEVETSLKGAPTFGSPQAAPGGGSAGVSVSYDMMNQALFSLWDRKAIGLGLDAEDLAAAGEALAGMNKDLFGGAQIQATVDNPHLPPIVTRGANSGTLRVSMGGVPVAIFAQSSNVSAKVEGDLGVVADIAIESTGSGVKASLAKVIEVHVNARTTLSANIQTKFDGNSAGDWGEKLMKVVGGLAARQMGQIAATLDLPVFDLSKVGVQGARVRLDALDVTPREASVDVSGRPALIWPGGGAPKP